MVATVHIRSTFGNQLADLQNKKSFLCNRVKLYNKLDKELCEMNGDHIQIKTKINIAKLLIMSQALNDDFIALGMFVCSLIFIQFFSLFQD